MASELRVNSSTNRSGLGTITYTDSGPIISGVGTFTNGFTVDGTQTTVKSLKLTGDNYNANWFKTTNKLRFNDNAKTTFGTSDDLQIYHTGSHSYIADEGAGELIISGSRVQLMNAARSGKLLDSVEGASGYLRLYQNNNIRLETTSTGVTISGTAVAGALDISGDIDVDGQTNLDNVDVVGIMTVTTNTQYHGYKLSNGTNLVGELVGLSGSNDTGALALWSGGSKYVQLSAVGNSFLKGGNFGLGDETPTNFTGYTNLSIHGSTGGAITFGDDGTDEWEIYGGDGILKVYDRANTSERLRLDANGVLSWRSGSTPLSGTGNPYTLNIYRDSGSGYGYLDCVTSSSNHTGWYMRAYHNGNYNKVIAHNTSNETWFETGGNERLRINGNGNVSIGGISAVATSTAYNKACLHIHNTTSGSNYGPQIRLTSAHTGSATGDGSHISVYSTSLYINNQENGDTHFYNNGSPTATIKANGNFGVNTQAPTDKLHVNGTALVSSNFYCNNNVYLAANKGIYFDGGTNAVNHLDDYETGTFTCTVYYATGNTTGSHTNTTNINGYYEKVGNLIFVSINLYPTNYNSGNQCIITKFSIPFTPVMRTAASFYRYSGAGNYGGMLAQSTQDDAGAYFNTDGFGYVIVGGTNQGSGYWGHHSGQVNANGAVAGTYRIT